MKKWKAKRACIYNGRYIYKDGIVVSEDEPNNHFELFGEPEKETDTDSQTLLEEQLKGMNVNKLADYIAKKYQIKIDRSQTKEQALIQALEIVRGNAEK